MNLSKGIKITRVAASSAAAQTDVTSSVLDMQGFDGVMYIALTGDVTSTSVLALTAKENTANSTSGSPTSITGGAATFTAGASDADNKALMVDVYRPQKRYQYCILSRGTANAVVDGIIAIQYCSANKPTTQDTGVIASAFAVGNA